MKLPEPSPDLTNIASDSELVRKLLQSDLSPEIEGRYLAWDELRHRAPPEGLTSVQWWAGVALARRFLSRPLPLRDSQGVPFHVTASDDVQRLLHELDRDLGGRIDLLESIDSPDVRDRYVMSALIEEAITSSQLEGASTTRRASCFRRRESTTRLDNLPSSSRPTSSGARI